MCTLTIIPQQQGLLLTMNRDERRTRHEAGLHDAGMLCYPVDGEAKGTWVGVNQCGVTMALLNRYQEPTREGAISRGHIIVDALQQGGYDAVLSYMQQLKPAQYNPFDCVVASVSGINHFTWTGSEFHQRTLPADTPLMLSSSSVNLEETLAHRRKLFNSWLDSSDPHKTIEQFHLYQQTGEESQSVMMARELSHTKSFTQIKIDDLTCQLSYYDQQAIQANSRLSDLSATAQWSRETLSSSSSNRVEVLEQRL